MQRNRFVTARRWLRGAESDLALAVDIADRYPARSAFHAQQSAEMALKSMLVALTDDHPTTHASSQLVREIRALPFEIPSAGYSDAAGDADPLDLVSAEDIALAIDRARRVVAFASTTVEALQKADA